RLAAATTGVAIEVAEIADESVLVPDRRFGDAVAIRIMLDGHACSGTVDGAVVAAHAVRQNFDAGVRIPAHGNRTAAGGASRAAAVGGQRGQEGRHDRGELNAVVETVEGQIG